ncbi:MAG: YqgE/AlgH family protein [Chitinophagales bacterium]|nr:YqgE/AlgH family protein [Chitinophagales bacterium]
MDISKIYRKDIKRGDLLIAEPFMEDAMFKRKVVLMCENSPEGSFGFILNTLSGFKINELIEDFPYFDAEVYVGGPVGEDTVHFLHRCGPIIDGTQKIRENIWWGGDFNSLKEEIRRGNIYPDDIRFFLGYSGWSAGQLEEEQDDQSWIVSSQYKDFFGDPEDLWKKVLTEMGSEFKIMANYPENPILN